MKYSTLFFEKLRYCCTAYPDDINNYQGKLTFQRKSDEMVLKKLAIFVQTEEFNRKACTVR